MKVNRGILVVFLAVMFITLTCGGGFAELNVGDYTLGGYISLGGGWLSDVPRHMNRDYLKKYVPFPEGFVGYTDLTLQSKEGLDYYGFWMSHPGLRDQDYLLQIGKIGVYHAQIEYDQLTNLYCSVNPINHDIGIAVQRLRFNGYYMPTPNTVLFLEDQWLRRTGTQAVTQNGGPPNAYNFTTTNLRPINYNQNDMRVGAEYDQPNNRQNDRETTFQVRTAYHFSTFDNGQSEFLGRGQPIGTTSFQVLPPSNMANYITAEGALNVKSYKTRLTGSLTYGWLSDNDHVFETNGRWGGDAGLTASTINADLAGISRPVDALTLRYGYRAYNYENTDKLSNTVIGRAFAGANAILLNPMQYSYLRQGANFGVDYRVTNWMAFTAGYAWQGVNRTNGQGSTSTSIPQVGARICPTNWLNLTANYAFSSQTGNRFLAGESEAEEGIPLTYKPYAANVIGNKFNIIAEILPSDTVTCSLNFSITNNNFRDSTLGVQSDRGWSGGFDVSWRPHDRLALSLGYDHQQLQDRKQAASNLILGEDGRVTPDAGTLTTSDSYDTVSARADVKLIPKKLDLTTRAVYSFSNSNFNNHAMPSLNSAYADIRTFLTYKVDEHWAVRGGYIFEFFNQSTAYQKLWLVGPQGNTNQFLNTLDGFYTNARAHIVQGFLQYKF